jgi:hypothetical protein
MTVLAVLLGLAFATAPAPAGCGDPPPRATDAYWSFIDACGCADLEPPSRASQDYDRYMKACSRWRERNPNLVATPRPRAKPAPKPSPAATPKTTSP